MMKKEDIARYIEERDANVSDGLSTLVAVVFAVQDGWLSMDSILHIIYEMRERLNRSREKFMPNFYWDAGSDRQD
jgi:hypothetical protein